MTTSEFLRMLGYIETKKISWKWRLKGLYCKSFAFMNLKKQRKSPENGDWKTPIPTEAYSPTSETKKISWKWRLKGSPPWTSWNREERRETKKISWKWRLKDTWWSSLHYWSRLRKQRKSPENGDWKRTFLCSSIIEQRTPKQRKSPENGDWKIFSTNLDASKTNGNKENLLKMEIESSFINA